MVIDKSGVLSGVLACVLCVYLHHTHFNFMGTFFPPVIWHSIILLIFFLHFILRIIGTVFGQSAAILAKQQSKFFEKIMDLFSTR